MIGLWPTVKGTPVLSSGYIIGWNNDNEYLCVAGIVPSSEFSSQFFQSQSQFPAFVQARLLGYCSIKDDESTELRLESDIKDASDPGLFLHLEIDAKQSPVSFPLLGQSSHIQWIFYERPNPINKHFYFISESSLIPVQQAGASRDMEAKIKSQLCFEPSRLNFQKLLDQMNHAEQLSALLRLHHPTAAYRYASEPLWIPLFWRWILAPIIWLVVSLSACLQRPIHYYMEKTWTRQSSFVKQLKLKTKEWASWSSLYQKLSRAEVRNTAAMRQFYIR